ncbi:hypothetical protein WN943_016157 [Citrus x changshan-huyou]
MSLCVSELKFLGHMDTRMDGDDGIIEHNHPTTSSMTDGSTALMTLECLEILNSVGIRRMKFFVQDFYSALGSSGSRNCFSAGVL